MDYRLLDGSGLKIPVLSFGTATFGGVNEIFKAWGAIDVEEATRLVDIYLEAGINMFDTANNYSEGVSEEILGKAIAVLRRPSVSSVVFGARNEEQLRENLDAVGWSLTPEQIAMLDEVSSVPLIYPYSHQRGPNRERNPSPLNA